MPDIGPYEQLELRPRRAGLDVETQRRIIELYGHRDATLRSVAEQVFVDPTTVWLVLVDNGIPRRPRGGSRPRTPIEQLLEVGELYASGMSLDEIAETLGCARTTVQRRLDRLGPRHRRTRSEAQRLARQRQRRTQP